VSYARSTPALQCFCHISWYFCGFPRNRKIRENSYPYLTILWNCLLIARWNCPIVARRGLQIHRSWLRWNRHLMELLIFNFFFLEHVLTNKRRIHLRSASVQTYTFFTVGFPRFLSIRGARGLQVFDLPLLTNYSTPNYD
jgi:hypothetical protein